MRVHLRVIRTRLQEGDVFCDQCGQAMANEARFCARCGKAVTVAAEPAPGIPLEAPPLQTPDPVSDPPPVAPPGLTAAEHQKLQEFVSTGLLDGCRNRAIWSRKGWRSIAESNQLHRAVESSVRECDRTRQLFAGAGRLVVVRTSRLGDVIELQTANGFAYAQITHRVRSWGTLIRVLQPLFRERPTDLKDLVKAPSRFVVFFPVNAAVNRRLVEIVGTAGIPDEAREFPQMRSGGIRRPDGTASDWWLWDGEREWSVGELTAELAHLPLRRLVNHAKLKSLIEEDRMPA
jgi:hypothetical protein